MLGMNKRAAKPAAAPYAVPSLADVDAAYAHLLELRARLLDEQRALEVEKRALVSEVEAAPAPVRTIRPGVAALLGDHIDNGPAIKRTRLAEVRSRLDDIGEALAELRKRLDEARGPASRRACEIVKPEYAARVRRLCEAMVALDEAHRHFDELRHGFEAEDISWLRLTPMTPGFLGASNEPDRRIARYLNEAAAAGYWSEPAR